MVVLKKIKASTLMETLIATVLVVVTFLLASMILNNLVSNTIQSDTQAIDTHLLELHYLQQHKQLTVPYSENFQNWSISIERLIEHNQAKIVIEASDLNRSKTIRKIYNELD
jgi:predicted PurR-regulated permease PerM